MSAAGDRVAALLAGLRGSAPLTASRLAALVGEELERAADTDAPRPVLTGLRDGLAAPAGPLVWPEALPDEDTSPELAHRAAVLSGRLLTALLPDAPEEAPLLRAVTYASALATPQGQRPLAAGDLVRAHTYACLLAERRGGGIGDEEERRLARWLWAQAGAAMAPDDRARLERLRQRRRAP